MGILGNRDVRVRIVELMHLYIVVPSRRNFGALLRSVKRSISRPSRIVFRMGGFPYPPFVLPEYGLLPRPPADPLPTGSRSAFRSDIALESFAISPIR